MSAPDFTPAEFRDRIAQQLGASGVLLVKVQQDEAQPVKTSPRPSWTARRAFEGGDKWTGGFKK